MSDPRDAERKLLYNLRQELHVARRLKVFDGAAPASALEAVHRQKSSHLA
jgi:hypothetical protein